MHLRGTFETMHRQPPVENILNEVSDGFYWSIKKAESFGVKAENIALDIGIGFGKSFEQNLELIAKLDTLSREFIDFPILVGTSRKSFIGKILGDKPPTERLFGSLSSVAIAVCNGAKIIRAHDVKETVDTIKLAQAVYGQKRFESRL
jgi:dihydropteroate synthase